MNNFAELTDAEIIEHLSQDYKMPTMFRYNGVGSAMMGKLRANKENAFYFKMFCFTFAHIPIYLRSIYYVQEQGRTVHSRGFITKRDFKRTFGRSLYRKLVLSVIWDYVFFLLIGLGIAGAVLIYLLFSKYYMHS